MAFFDVIRSLFGPTLRPMVVGVWTPIEHVQSAGAIQRLLMADDYFASLSIGITLAKVFVAARCDPMRFTDLASIPVKNALQRTKISRQARAAEDEEMLGRLRTQIGHPTSRPELFRALASVSLSLFTEDWIGSVWSEIIPIDGCNSVEVSIHPMADGSHIFLHVESFVIGVFSSPRIVITDDTDLNELARLPLENAAERIAMASDQRRLDDELLLRRLHKVIGWPTTIAVLQRTLDPIERSCLSAKKP